jgi:hypothetical protein
LGVVKIFINRKLPPHEFLEITKDEYVFKKLVDIAAYYMDGCSYLEAVSSWAKGSDDEVSCRLGEIVEGAVRRSIWSFDR